MALTKIDDRGLKTPVDLLDNEKIRFGTGNDLEIFHDNNSKIVGSSGYTRVAATAGMVYLDGNNVYCRSGDGGEYLAKFIDNGASQLFYDNSLKLETTSTGITVDGDIDGIPDGSKILIGTHDDMQLYHQTNSSYIKASNHTIHIDSGTTSAIRIISGTSTTYGKMADFNTDGSVDLYHDNSKKFETTADGIQVTGKIFSSSHIDLADDIQLLLGTGDDLSIYHDGSNSYIKHAGGGNLRIEAAGGADEDIIIKAKDAIFLQPADGEAGVSLAANGAVSLYYDNSIKLHTASDGVSVTGVINNQHLRGGSGDMYVGNAAQGDLYIYVQDNTNNSIILQANTGEKYLEAAMGGGVDLYHHGTKKFDTVSGGTRIYGYLSMQGSGGHIYLPDDAELKIGNGEDLQIYHTGSHSIIKNSTGDLQLRGDHIDFWTGDGSERIFESTINSSVELYYDHSKKFETHSAGCKVSAGNLYLDRDNAKLVIGASDDIEIYHNGSNSVIQHAGGGHLYVQTTGTDEDLILKANRDVYIEAHAGEAAAKFFKNGKVELYNDNVKKFETKSYGCNLIGDLHMTAGDNYQLKFGAGDDLKIYHSGSHSFIDHTGTGNIHIRGNGTNATKLQAKQGEDSLTCLPDGAVELYHNSNKKLETQSTGVKVYGDLEVTGSGGGKLIGYSNTNDTTARTFSADTWTDCGLSITYTPQKASSKILLTAYLNLWGGSQQASNVTNDGRFNFRILEGSNVVGEDQRVDFGKGVNSTYLHYATVKEWQFTLFAQYSNSNTNAKTFKVQLYEDSGELKQNTNNGLSHFTVMEIDA